MREILFRGKSQDTGKWIYGSYHKPFEDVEQIIESIKTNASQMSLVELGTCGQFTGLTDKNGKKVFEGDKLTNPKGDIGVIEFYEGNFVLVSQKKYNMIRITLDAGFMLNKEIIGNIHEKEGNNG